MNVKFPFQADYRGRTAVTDDDSQFLVQSSLQQWLGDLINVTDVSVENEDSALRVTVSYTVILNQQSNTVVFNRKI